MVRSVTVLFGLFLLTRHSAFGIQLMLCYTCNCDFFFSLRINLEKLCDQGLPSLSNMPTNQCRSSRFSGRAAGILQLSRQKCVFGVIATTESAAQKTA